MKSTIFCLFITGLMIQSVSASVYRLKETVPYAGHPDTLQLTARDSVIVLDSDTPGSLKVMGLRFDMTRKYSSRKTGEKSWTEYYSVPEYGYQVGLKKDTERGVTAILLRDRNKNLFRYVPKDAPVPVSYVPPILVRKAVFEYFDKDGNTIGTSEELPSADWVKKLDTELECQSFTADSMILYVKITDKDGKCYRTKRSPDNCSYMIPIRTDVTNVPANIYAGHWEKKLKKYDRFEIYDSQGRQLFCTPIPIKGRIVRLPVFMYCGCDKCRNWNPNRGISVRQYPYFERIAIEKTIGDHVPRYGIITGWRNVEADNKKW